MRLLNVSQRICLMNGNGYCPIDHRVQHGYTTLVRFFSVGVVMPERRTCDEEPSFLREE